MDGCRQTGSLLVYTVCVGIGFGMKLACKSEYLHPQKQTTKLRLYISNWAHWAKSAAVSRSISLKLCLSNQTSLIISAVTLTSHFKICFCKKFFRNQVRHWLWQFSLYTLLSQLITADFFSSDPYHSDASALIREITDYFQTPMNTSMASSLFYGCLWVWPYHFKPQTNIGI